MAVAKKGGRSEAPYNFEPAFERGMVFLACTQPRFMSRAAHELRSDLLNLPECKLALDAAHDILRETGRGPSNSAVVIQTVALKRDAGKITQEQVRSVSGLFDLYDDRPMPLLEEFEPAVLAVLKKRLRFEVAQASVGEHAEEKWDKVEKLLTREARLGVQAKKHGVVATAAAGTAAMRAMREMERVKFGIEALDNAFGGVPQDSLTVFMAASGGGKSMALSHITGQCSIQNRLVLYATLELPVPKVLARVMANQTGQLIRHVEDGLVDEDLKTYERCFGWTPPVIESFESGLTTVPMIAEWVSDVEQSQGRKCEVLVIDYADKLAGSVKKNSEKSNGYQEMATVYQGLWDLCNQRKILGVTASQSRGRDERQKNKTLDMEHVADSTHKVRISDHFVTLNFDDELKEMTFFLAKNRYGEGRIKAGPVPTALECGQVSPVSRPVPVNVIKHHNAPQNTPIATPWETKQNQHAAMSESLFGGSDVD